MILVPLGLQFLAVSVVHAWTYANDGIATVTHYTMDVVRTNISSSYARCIKYLALPGNNCQLWLYRRKHAFSNCCSVCAGFWE